MQARREATDQPDRPERRTALDTAAERFAAIIAEHGPDAVAVYGAGQLLTEDYYVFNKLVKGLIGTNNLDNPVLTKVRTTLTRYGAIGAAVALVVGLVAGFLLGRRRANRAAVAG